MVGVTTRSSRGSLGSAGSAAAPAASAQERDDSNAEEAPSDDDDEHQDDNGEEEDDDDDDDSKCKLCGMDLSRMRGSGIAMHRKTCKERRGGAGTCVVLLHDSQSLATRSSP